MRILITIPHYFGPPKPTVKERYGSTHGDRETRIAALRNAIIACHQHFGPQGMLYSGKSKSFVRPSNVDRITSVDVVVMTTGGHHLLASLDLPESCIKHQVFDGDPMMLGFACHRELAAHLGSYDYYAYIEDDLIITDPNFFDKLNFFNKGHEQLCVLLPNRYETTVQSRYRKLYIDRTVLKNLQRQDVDPEDRRILKGTFLNRPLLLERPTNPHSGCFFLTAQQMRIWMEKPFFLDYDVDFVGPLESAATLGIMRTFKIYKAHSSCANFFEIQHACNRHIERNFKLTPSA
ncbi:hypothetical protein [Azospirillum doebereinerae]